MFNTSGSLNLFQDLCPMQHTETTDSEVKLPAYKAGNKNNIVINDNSICIPLFGKEGLPALGRVRGVF
jgi:hypothetical protein